jgi:hypothetical protein
MVCGIMIITILVIFTKKKRKVFGYYKKEYKTNNIMKQEQIDFYLILEKNGKLLSFYKDLAKPQIYHLHLDGEIENYQKHEIYIHDQKYVATVVKNNNLVTGDSFFIYFGWIFFFYIIVINTSKNIIASQSI